MAEPPPAGLNRPAHVQYRLAQSENAVADSLPSPDTSPQVQQAFERLSAALKGLPDAPLSEAAAAKLLSGMGLAPQEKQTTFRAPSEVEILGSFAHGTLLSGHPVDVAVQLPCKCLLEKDYLNGKYLGRRAAYLHHLAGLLRKKKHGFKQQSWEHLDGDIRKPVLILSLPPPGTPCNGTHSSGPQAPAMLFRILPVIHEAQFPAQKLHPGRNNLRGHATGLGSDAADPPELLPTPSYNAAVLQDMLARQQSRSFTQLLQQDTALRKAIILLKVWADQHGLSSDKGGELSGHLLTAYAVHIHNSSLLVPGMTAIQVLRTILQQLAQPSALAGNDSSYMRSAPASQSSENAADGALKPTPATKAAFKAQYRAVLVEPSGHLNLAAAVSASGLQQVRRAAQRTVSLLNDEAHAEAAFDAALLTPSHPAAGFDCWWRVEVPEPAALKLPGSLLEQPLLRQLQLNTEDLARKAFGTRAVLVRALTQGASGAQAAACSFLLAAQVDAGEAARMLDKGPSPGSPAAAAFRQFWGDKAELRRFQDGSISEAVAWECPPQERHLILDRILQHVLSRHLDGSVALHSHSALLGPVLAPKSFLPAAQHSAFRTVQTAFQQLAKQLRSLSLALGVVAVQPIGPAYRRTAMFPPAPHPLAMAERASLSKDDVIPRCLEPVEVLVQLEGSGKWPKDLAAYYKTKAAMGAQLAEELTGSYGLHAAPSEHCVDVFVQGIAFRIFLHSVRDAAIAKQPPASAPAGQQPRPGQPRPPSYPQLMARSAHHALISAVGDAHPAFCGTVCVTKRWAQQQLLSQHLGQEALELVCAAAFTQPALTAPPGTVPAGWLRVLTLLSQHPWALRPLVVDPFRDLSAAQVAAAQAAFDQARQAGSVVPMALASRDDLSLLAWTSRSSPSLAVRGRIVALANRALSAFRAQEHAFQGVGTAAAALDAAFGPPLVDFDLLIRLRGTAVPGSELGMAPVPADRLESESTAASAVCQGVPYGALAQRGPAAARAELLVGFDPVAAYLAVLQARFGHLGAFCAGLHGSYLIAVRWHPQAFQPRVFAADSAACTVPAQRRAEAAQAPAKRQKRAQYAQQVAVSQEAVLLEMARMGAGLVQSIQPIMVD